MKFVDVFQFLNYVLEGNVLRLNCFLLQLLGGCASKRTLDREAGVCFSVLSLHSGHVSRFMNHISIQNHKWFLFFIEYSINILIKMESLNDNS